MEINFYYFKGSEEIKADNSIQDANMKREFILNRIKKLQDKKYIQNIEDAKARIAKKLNKMKTNDELGSEADGLLEKFNIKNYQKIKNKNPKTNKNIKIVNKFQSGNAQDLFGLDKKPAFDKKKKRVNVNKGKLNLNQLSKFAKRILLEDNLSAVKEFGKNKDVNQNICWEMMYDLLWKDAQEGDYEIDESEIYKMD